MANALCISNNALLIRNNALSIGCGGGGPATNCFAVFAVPCDRPLEAAPGQTLPLITPTDTPWPWVASMTIRSSGSRTDRETPTANPSQFDETAIVTTRPREVVDEWAFVLRARLISNGSPGPWFPDLSAIQAAHPFATSDVGVAITVSNTGDGTYDAGYSFFRSTSFDAGEALTTRVNNGVPSAPTMGPAFAPYLAALSNIVATNRNLSIALPTPQQLLPPWYLSIPGRPLFWQLEHCDSASASGGLGGGRTASASGSWGFSGSAASLDYSGSATATGASTTSFSNRQWDCEGSFQISTTIEQNAPAVIAGYPGGAPGPEQVVPACFSNRSAPPTDPRVAALSPENNVCKGCGE
jgi:hypothetical protein